eukprot:7151326-Prymnesium_polylepis.1
MQREAPSHRGEGQKARKGVRTCKGGRKKEGAGRPMGIGSCAIGQMDVCGSAAAESVLGFAPCTR